MFLISKREKRAMDLVEDLDIGARIPLSFLALHPLQALEGMRTTKTIIFSLYCNLN